MTIRWVLLTIACVLLLSIGQLLFKTAAGQWHIDGWGWATWRSFLSLPLIAALMLYAGTTVLWVFVLRQLPLSVAYPIYAVSFLIVPLLSFVVLGEPVTAKTVVGAAMIVAGIVVATT